MDDEAPLSIRYRKLPHWTLHGATYFVTYRLAHDYLDESEVKLVLDHLISGGPQIYTLIAATIMPDHVHIIVTPLQNIPLATIMKGIKGVSARLINRSRRTGGTVWQAESFDRIIRDEQELQEKLVYLLNNPVKAGLVEDGWDYHGTYISPEDVR